MLIFGIFFVIGENINSFVKSVEDAQGISVYLVNTATDEEIERVGEEILQIDGVRDAKYISKEEALEKMRDRLGDSMVEGYIERNILTQKQVTQVLILPKQGESLLLCIFIYFPFGAHHLGNSIQSL